METKKENFSATAATTAAAAAADAAAADAAPVLSEEEMDLNDDPEEQKRIFLDIASNIPGPDFNVSKWQMALTENKLLKPMTLDEGAFIKPQDWGKPAIDTYESPYYSGAPLRENKQWIWADVRKQREEHLKQLRKEEREERQARIEDGSEPYCRCVSGRPG